MSSWQPVPGKGNELRRTLECYGKPSVLVAVSRMVGLDSFNFVALAVCGAGNGTLVCKAKATSVVEAKVIADALAKYVRHQAMRKVRKDARRDMKRGSVERELLGHVGIDGIDGIDGGAE